MSDKILRAILLARWDDFRTLRWEEVFKEPEVALKQMKEILIIA